MSAPNPALLLRQVDRLDRAARSAEAIYDLAAAMTKNGEGDGEPIAEIALTMTRRMDKVRRDIEKYRHALPK